MIYKVEYLPSVYKKMEKMDNFIKRMLYNWIDKNLQNCENPRLLGKPLSSDRAGQWRYRVGDYRIIVKIEDARLIVLVINVGHRKEVYK